LISCDVAFFSCFGKISTNSFSRYRACDRASRHNGEENAKESAKESKRATHVSGGAYDEHRHPESHIFDGKGLLSDSTSFQICDITDPVLHQLLHDADARSDTFDPRSGWYITANLDRIRALMRHKLFLLRSPGGPQVISEEESMRWLREESDYYVRNESKTQIKAVPGGKTAKTAAAHRKRNRAKEQLSDAQRQVRDEICIMPLLRLV